MFPMQSLTENREKTGEWGIAYNCAVVKMRPPKYAEILRSRSVGEEDREEVQEPRRSRGPGAGKVLENKKNSTKIKRGPRMTLKRLKKVGLQPSIDHCPVSFILHHR